MRSPKQGASGSSPTRRQARTSSARSCARPSTSFREADTLVVPSLDRLGRSLQDLIAIVSGLRERGVDFTSLHETLDTTTPGGRLVFHVFEALAEFIRELIAATSSSRRSPSGAWEQGRCPRLAGVGPAGGWGRDDGRRGRRLPGNRADRPVLQKGRTPPPARPGREQRRIPAGAGPRRAHLARMKNWQGPPRLAPGRRRPSPRRRHHVQPRHDAVKQQAGRHTDLPVPTLR